MNLKLMPKLLFVLILISSFAIAQPRKVMERIATMKKVKMLDVLDLESSQEDKLLVIYNKYEKMLLENRENSKEIEQELREAIRSEKESDIITLSDTFIANRDEVMTIIKEKDTAIKEILSPDKFATYLIFEKRFKEEIGKHLMKRGLR